LVDIDSSKLFQQQARGKGRQNDESPL